MNKALKGTLMAGLVIAGLLLVILVAQAAGDLRTVRVVRDGLGEFDLEVTLYYNQVPPPPPTLVLNRVVECRPPFNKYVIDTFYNATGAQQVRVGCAVLLPTPAPTEEPNP